MSLKSILKVYKDNKQLITDTFSNELANCKTKSEYTKIHNLYKEKLYTLHEYTINRILKEIEY